MKATSSFLNDAKALALFANLKSDEDAEYFGRNYTEFLPSELWQTPKLWNALSEQVQTAWQGPAKFPLETCIQLIGIVEKFSQQARVMEQVTRNMERGKVPTAIEIPKPEVWPFQRAVMFLGIDPWRPSICSNCGKRFVKDKSSRRFCSDKCFQDSRKLAKRSWWGEHGQDLRNRKRKAKPRKKGKP